MIDITFLVTMVKSHGFISIDGTQHEQHVYFLANDVLPFLETRL